MTMRRPQALFGRSRQLSGADFIARWSRLKRDSRQSLNAPDRESGNTQKAAAENEEPGTNQAATATAMTDRDMPDVDTLTPESDYSGFLSPGVSDELRKLALRKLFRSEVFNIRDGLDEYDDDFTRFEKLGDIITSDMRHQLDLELKRQSEQHMEHQEKLSTKENQELEAIQRETGCTDKASSGSKCQGHTGVESPDTLLDSNHEADRVCSSQTDAPDQATAAHRSTAVAAIPSQQGSSDRAKDGEDTHLDNGG